jgi:hypothetical protein
MMKASIDLHVTCERGRQRSTSGGDPIKNSTLDTLRVIGPCIRSTLLDLDVGISKCIVLGLCNIPSRQHEEFLLPIRLTDALRDLETAPRVTCIHDTPFFPWSLFMSRNCWEIGERNILACEFFVRLVSMFHFTQYPIVEEGVDAAQCMDSTAKVTAMVNEGICACPNNFDDSEYHPIPVIPGRTVSFSGPTAVHSRAADGPELKEASFRRFWTLLREGKKTTAGGKGLLDRKLEGIRPFILND